MKTKFLQLRMVMSLTLMVLLLGVAENAIAEEEIYIGDGSTTTNNYIPSYSYYEYSLSQQIYTAADLGGDSGFITKIAFYNGGAEKTRSYDIYLVTTAKNAFSSTSDWITVTESDLVFSGSVTMTANDWTWME